MASAEYLGRPENHLVFSSREGEHIVMYGLRGTVAKRIKFSEFVTEFELDLKDRDGLTHRVSGVLIDREGNDFTK